MATLNLLVIAVAVLVAGAALLRARRVSERLAQLTDAYWELRYEYGQLRARLNRLEGIDSEPGPVDPPVQASFVPLSSLKK